MPRTNSFETKGAILNNQELYNYIRQLSMEQVLWNKSDTKTIPIETIKKSYNIISDTYNILNRSISFGLPIHPAGEWIVDNFYIIEKVVKETIKDLNKKMYCKLIGIKTGRYKGYARTYILAKEIVNHTDSRINEEIIEECLSAYQNEKSLELQEIYSINLFLNVAIVESISYICEKIYNSQVGRYKVENIIERRVEGKAEDNQLFKNSRKFIQKGNVGQLNTTFIEYMSYKLKKLGKQTREYVEALEETVEKLGTTLADIIKQEHYDVAIKRISIGNSIMSLRDLQNIDFISIYEKTSQVEKMLSLDPSGIYPIMEHDTKKGYKKTAKKIADKFKVSDVYITSQAIEMAILAEGKKERHVGYYLVDEGKDKLLKKLGYKENIFVKINRCLSKYKLGIYICSIYLPALIISLLMSAKIGNIFLKMLTFITLNLSLTEIFTQIIQYTVSKMVLPKHVPKIDFLASGINEENATFVVIPTLLNTKEKVKEMMEALEVYYLANRSKNIYFALLGDTSEEDKMVVPHDEEIIKEGKLCVFKLNEKYKNEDDNFPIFHFLYRGRVFNSAQAKCLGWERKRGMLIEFNRLLLNGDKGSFIENTIGNPPKIKYVITLDADTNLILDSTSHMIGAMAHILNEPEINKNKKRVEKRICNYAA